MLYFTGRHYNCMSMYNTNKDNDIEFIYLTPIKFRPPLIFEKGEGRKLKGANWAPKIGGSEN